MRYVDRVDAGRVLASDIVETLHRAGETDSPLVLGVPRGGVIVAAEVARALGGDLNVALARKIGAPGNPELAIGAVGETGDAILSEDLIADLGVSGEEVASRTDAARLELHRRLRRYRKVKPAPQIEDRVVVVVDDGVATGATFQATLQAVRRQKPEFLVGAVPVGPPDSVGKLSGAADIFICPLRPRWFRAVGEWYDRFNQTTDDEVIATLVWEAGH